MNPRRKTTKALPMRVTANRKPTRQGKEILNEGNKHSKDRRDMPETQEVIRGI